MEKWVEMILNWEHTVQFSDRERSWLCLMTEVQETLTKLYAWCKEMQWECSPIESALDLDSGKFKRLSN